jgi:hypothetical protein
VEEHRRVHEDVDETHGTAKQGRPEIRGYVGAVRVQRNELRLARSPNAFAVRNIRPQIRLRLSDKPHEPRTMPGVRSPPVDPPLNGLRIDARRLNDRVEVDAGDSHSGSQTLVDHNVLPRTFWDTITLPGRPDTSRHAVETSKALVQSGVQMTRSETFELDPRLIDELADRLSDAIAKRVVAAFREGSVQPVRTSMAWLDAQQVARQLGVSRDWVYEHADELGASRIGAGPRPRIRFPADVVDSRRGKLTSCEAASGPTKPRSRPNGLIPIHAS